MKVNLEDCILWSKAKDYNGYGKKNVDNKTFLSHRLSYCEHHNIDLEEIKGVVVRHKCDNPSCVNPLHLELGSHRDNTRDAIGRGRRPATKLSLSKAKQVWAMKGEGYNQSQIARHFGTSPSCISRVISGILWSDAKPC